MYAITVVDSVAPVCVYVIEFESTAVLISFNGVTDVVMLAIDLANDSMRAGIPFILAVRDLLKLSTVTLSIATYVDIFV